MNLDEIPLTIFALPAGGLLILLVIGFILLRVLA